MQTNSIWGHRARDWAEIQEKQGINGYAFVLNELNISPAHHLLDVGCGTGLFCGLVAKQGAGVTGIDAAGVFIKEAVTRVPEGTFLVGKMEKLPFPDHTFDIVTAFNALQYAEDPLLALSEAGRVLTEDGILTILLWGDPSHCEVISLLKVFEELTSTTPGTHNNPFSLSGPNQLTSMLSSLPIHDIQTHVIPSYWEYPDQLTALRGWLSLGAASRAIDMRGIDIVRAALEKLIPSFTRADGSVSLRNEYQIVLCRKLSTSPSLFIQEKIE